MATKKKDKEHQKRKQILIIDEHPVYREGFKTRLERDPRFSIIGEAGTGGEGIRLAKLLKPDLVVTEILLPDQDGFQFIQSLRRLFPDMPVMILSAFRQIPYVTQAIRSGAMGYLSKESPCESILDGLEAVIGGDDYLEESLSPPDLFMGIHSPAWGYEKTVIGSYGHLTPREKEIMKLLAEGESRKQIAQRLSISLRTVENHAASIMRKLSLKNTVELVRCAAKFGLINVDEWKGGSLVAQYSGSLLEGRT